jgi:predicted dehydrogenase
MLILRAASGFMLFLLAFEFRGREDGGNVLLGAAILMSSLGTIEAATSAYPGYSRRIELTGAHGTIRIEGDDLVGLDLRDVPDAERPRATAAPTAAATSPVVADASAHQRVFADFIQAVADRRPPCCDGRDGRRSVALIEAIYQSARENRLLDL